MLLSLVDSLRCPADHEESPLVLSADAWRGARISSGTLGCPICHARYQIRNGTVLFADEAVMEGASAAAGMDVLRLAAQLDLGEPGGLVLLTGRYTTAVDRLAALIDAVYVLVDSGGAVAETAVNFSLGRRIPFASGSFRGAAVDQVRGTAEFLTEVARTVRASGRVVAPAGTQLVDGFQLLARDELEWVAEIESAVSVVPLRRSLHR